MGLSRSSGWGSGTQLLLMKRSDAPGQQGEAVHRNHSVSCPPLLSLFLSLSLSFPTPHFLFVMLTASRGGSIAEVWVVDRCSVEEMQRGGGGRGGGGGGKEEREKSSREASMGGTDEEEMFQ